MTKQKKTTKKKVATMKATPKMKKNNETTPKSKNKVETKKRVATFSYLPAGFSVDGHNKNNGTITDIALSTHSSLPRYSDNELQEFEDLLKRRETRERKELKFLDELLTSSNESPGGFSEDNAVISAEREGLVQQRSRITVTLEKIQKAYARIRNKSYGRCATSNKLIDKARLRVHLWATECIEAKVQRQTKKEFA